jgi:hypothetical protein
MMIIALMMEAARTSETLVNFYQTRRRFNPEDSHLLDLNNVSDFSPYLKENTVRPHDSDQFVNAFWGNNRCLF